MNRVAIRARVARTFLSEQSYPAHTSLAPPIARGNLLPSQPALSGRDFAEYTPVFLSDSPVIAKHDQTTLPVKLVLKSSESCSPSG